jgi:hypothetical protein
VQAAKEVPQQVIRWVLETRLLDTGTVLFDEIPRKPPYGFWLVGPHRFSHLRRAVLTQGFLSGLQPAGLDMGTDEDRASLYP